jgi:peptidoglycan/LPS O-acetylase OafA/YrhL
MQLTDRLHALDAVRAYALLLGVVLHSAAAFLEGFPIPLWATGDSSAGAAVIYYTIHMFRMSAFFLIAGFFARVLVERRGVKAFVKDRAKRVAVPLFLFGPFVLIMISVGFMLGALTHGVDYLRELAQEAAQPPPAGAPGATAATGAEGGGGPIQTAHLWFLYYLLIFYALTLALRRLVRAVDPRGRLAAAADRVVRFVMSGVWGPVLIAVPIAAYWWQLASWTEWLGLPAPFSLVPNATALVGYGTAFGLGWLLNRQVQALLDLQKLWYVYLVLAVALTIFCLTTIGTTPRWVGGNLAGTQRILYAAGYAVGLWCWVFAFVGAAVRFLSKPSPVTRYLADASYWVYLMHMTTIMFFLTAMRPYDWHWTVKLAICVGGSMPILLVTYHYLVRFTWIGAILNGRRHPRPEKSPPPDTAPATS